MTKQSPNVQLKALMPVVIPSSASVPVDPVEGQIYLNTTYEQLRIFFMGQWYAIVTLIV